MAASRFWEGTLGFSGNSDADADGQIDMMEFRWLTEQTPQLHVAVRGREHRAVSSEGPVESTVSSQQAVWVAWLLWRPETACDVLVPAQTAYFGVSAHFIEKQGLKMNWHTWLARDI